LAVNARGQKRYNALKKKPKKELLIQLRLIEANYFLKILSSGLQPKFVNVRWVPHGYETNTDCLKIFPSHRFFFKNVREIKMKPLLHKTFKAVQQFYQNLSITVANVWIW
jgi:hypothetical protein